MSVTFQNKGLLPIDAITTMGVSVKETDNAIGFFGTGMKYAISVLLRNTHKIVVYVGMDRYEFATKNKEVRGKSFDFVFMNEQQLGFTTHLGANWEMWQAFRELYSNCLDEKGDMHIGHASISPRDGYTTIIVVGEQFENEAAQKEKYFLSTNAVHKHSYIHLHPGPSRDVYYRGIRVHQLEEESAYTLNLISKSELTEDRTLKDSYDINWRYVMALCQAPIDILETAILNVEGLEKDLSFRSYGEDDLFKRILELADKHGPLAICPNALAAAEIFAKREALVTQMELNFRDKKKLEHAVNFLKKLGYTVDCEIIVTESLGPNVMGMAKNGKIYVAHTAFTKGPNYLIGTVMEEYLHITHKFQDESRRFQDYLIDLVVDLAQDL